MKTKHDPRHQARRFAIQTLFEWLYQQTDAPRQKIAEDLLDQKKEQPKETESQEDEKITPYDAKLLENIINGVVEHKAKIDEVITQCAPEWPLDQIARVDLSILRVAVFELLFLEKTPTKVAIDEAVELAKEFGGGNSSKFVNGVLGTVVKKYVE